MRCSISAQACNDHKEGVGYAAHASSRLERQWLWPLGGTETDNSRWGIAIRNLTGVQPLRHQPWGWRQHRFIVYTRPKSPCGVARRAI